ncbi:MAG: magnesium transporter [Flavobacteriales bacterium]|nr:magnesium transporter [Flavobacteriales bacterium]
MQFEINKENLDHLKDLIANGHDGEINGLIGELHPADIADIIDELRTEDASYLFKLIDADTSANVLIELEEDVREKLLHSLTPKEIAEEVIEKMDSDDAVDVISELPDEKKQEVISHIEDEAQASDLIELLTYPEGSAGALMATELIKVNQNWTVGMCIREMRKQAEDLENVYTIYVVDDRDQLLGRLSLKKLLFTSSSTRTIVKDIFKEENLITVSSDTPAEEVANMMEKYDLVTVPVVSDASILLGRITIDDVVDVIVEEAEKDYQMASGLSEDVESRDSIWTLTRARLPWLLIGMAGGILGASVIGAFDIEKSPELALFIPLIAAMGGNVGVQSAAIVVQGLANKSLRNEALGGKLLKELGVALLNGTICAIILLSTSMVLDFGLGLSLTVSISLIGVIIFAAIFGTLVPLMLDKYKIDPALATGPFVTTANDIFGLIIYFVTGQIIMGELQANFASLAF